MIGQERIIQELNKYNLNNLPKTILLLGPSGCGKTTLIAELAKKFNIKLENLDFKLGSHSDGNVEIDKIKQVLNDISQCVIKKFYLINFDTLIDKRWNRHQASLLKFLEEPGQNNYIFLTATSEIGILPTILNRCFKIKFDKYSKEQLQQIRLYNDQKVYDLFSTPGQLIKLDQTIGEEVFNKYYNYINDICLKLKERPFANLFSFSELIDYSVKEQTDFNKINTELFMKIIEFVLYNYYIETKDAVYLKAYKKTNEFKNYLSDPLIDRDYFVYNYLINLYEVTR